MAPVIGQEGLVERLEDPGKHFGVLLLLLDEEFGGS